MRWATLAEEKRLWKRGFKNVVCVDEAGRGPLAGPVVAAAVISKLGSKLGRLSLHSIRDSKQLSAKQRERFYKLITENKNIKWGVGIVSEKVIDKINILEATKLAMGEAVKDLQKRSIIKFADRRILCKVDFLILDGRIMLNLKIPQKSIVKADEKVFSCALASIVAKVTRDRLMLKEHRKYSRYRFNLHKGYGTSLHYKLLKKFGPCAIHRRSFKLR